jgi:hypothetical protein
MRLGQGTFAEKRTRKFISAGGLSPFVRRRSPTFFPQSEAKIPLTRIMICLSSLFLSGEASGVRQPDQALKTKVVEGRKEPTLLSPFTSVLNQGAKYPKISSTRCVGFEANASIEPLFVGTMARFDVTKPSPALRVETPG